MDGTVTITLKDFQELVDANKNASEVQGKTRLAAKELEVFLSFLCTRTDVEKVVGEFNKQSRTSEITFDGTRAKITFKNDKKNNS